MQDDREGFAPIAEDSNDESASMLSPRARHAALTLGSTNDSAIFLDTLPSQYSAAPHHSLGDDDDFSSGSSNRSSVEIPSQSRNPFVDAPTGGADSSLHLHRQTLAGKLSQHADDRIDGLEEKLHGDSQGQELLELEVEEREFEQSLGARTVKPADDWDLLGEIEPPLDNGKKD